MNKKPADMTNEELIKHEKITKTSAITFMGVLIVSFVVIVSLMIKKGFTALIVTPIALLPILILLLNNWNETKKEIKSRNLS